MNLTNKIMSLCVVALLTLAACGRKELVTTDKPLVFDDAFLKNIKTYTATAASIEEVLKLTGKVDYDPNKRIDYVPLLSGVVTAVHFNLGDKVQKGQVIAELKSADLSALQAEQQGLDAEVKTATRNLEGVQGMYNDNLASQKDLLEAEGMLNKAKADLERVKTNLTLYGASANGGTLTIKAPISGYVVAKNITPGVQVMAQSSPLFSIADLSNVWIIANVYAGNLEFVKEGMEVDINALSYPNEIFHGKINALPQVFDPDEHVIKARIIMPNPDLKLKPEMSVDVLLKNTSKQKMIVLPTEALIFDGDRYFVIVQGAVPADLHISEVVVNNNSNGMSYIKSGVTEGDKIVVANQLLIYQHINNLKSK